MRRALAICAVLITGPVCADEPDLLALQAADMLAAAAQQLDAAEKASDRISALTDTVRAYETGLAAMRLGLRQTEARADDIRARLSGEDAELGDLLTLLQSVSRQSGVKSVVHPGSAIDTIRAGTLTASLVPTLQMRADVLAAELDDLENLIALQASGKASLEAGLEDVRRARLSLSTALAERTDLPPLLATDEAAMEALFNVAETLGAFANSLLPEDVQSVQFGDGQMVLPVTGQALRAFNEPDAAGISRPGIVIATSAQALVTAPADATVRFSKPVPGQGIVTIIEPKPGALVILAGMERSFVRLNQIVTIGEPLGLMGGDPTLEQKNLNKSTEDSGPFGQETLYMEVRQGRTPVNPAELLRLDEE